MLNRRKMVLVIEDDSAIRDTVVLMLEADGFLVSTAANGEEALGFLRSHELPGLILCDLMMPVMNGWEFLAAQQNSSQLKEVPVIVTSAVGERPKGVSSVKGFLRKPFSIDSLLCAAHEFCG